MQQLFKEVGDSIEFLVQKQVTGVLEKKHDAQIRVSDPKFLGERSSQEH